MWADSCARPTCSVRGQSWFFPGTFLLCFREGRGDVIKRSDMLIDIRFRVLHRHRPLLVLPIRLRHYSTIHHAEPVVAPQIQIDPEPIAIVLDLLRAEL